MGKEREKRKMKGETTKSNEKKKKEKKTSTEAEREATGGRGEGWFRPLYLFVKFRDGFLRLIIDVRANPRDRSIEGGGS